MQIPLSGELQVGIGLYGRSGLFEASEFHVFVKVGEGFGAEGFDEVPSEIALKAGAIE